jgi:hypothetical protein
LQQNELENWWLGVRDGNSQLAADRGVMRAPTEIFPSSFSESKLASGRASPRLVRVRKEFVYIFRTDALLETSTARNG